MRYGNASFRRAGFEAFVNADIPMFGHRIWLREGEWLIDGEGRRHAFTPGAVQPSAHSFAYIPDGAAPAILAALAQALGAVEHPEQLREDYLAERARVDKFIDMLRPRLAVVGK